MHDLRRNGIALTIGALAMETNNLIDEMANAELAQLQNASLATVKAELEAVYKRASRIAALAGSESWNLANYLNRHAKV